MTAADRRVSAAVGGRRAARQIPITGSTDGTVFTGHVSHNVPLLAFEVADGLGVQSGS